MGAIDIVFSRTGMKHTAVAHGPQMAGTSSLTQDATSGPSANAQLYSARLVTSLLRAGPMIMSWPVPSPDGKRLFATVTLPGPLTDQGWHMAAAHTHIPTGKPTRRSLLSENST